MTVPVVVPDASVLLKWVLESKDEENRDRALALRELWLTGKCELVVPTLWVFELGNILGSKQPREASELMKLMIDYRFEEEPPEGFYANALELMRKYRVTFYDAAYHAVAMNRSGTFITADGAYSRKTAAAGRVVKLSDWNPQPGAATKSKSLQN